MEKILVLQLNRLGDLVQTLPLLRRLRREYPIAEITLVCLRGVHILVADCGHFNRLITLMEGDVESLDIPERREAFPNVAPFDKYPEFTETYSLVINLTSDLGSAILNERVQARQKLGRIHTYADEVRLLGLWSKYLFAMVSNRLDNLFNIVDLQTGMAGLPLQPEPPSLPVSDVQHAEAQALLGSYGRRRSGPLIGLQTGASQLHRAWAVENFAELARNLIESDGAEIVILGDPSERDRSEKLQALLGLPVIDLVGRTSLVQLPAILAACDLLVSNDTGTIHIAAAVGTRTLGLFFSTAYFSETAPYGAGHAVLQVEIPCAPCHATSPCPVQLCREFLPPIAVYEATKWMLANSATPQMSSSESCSPGTGPLSKAVGLPPRRQNLSLYLSRFLDNGSLIYLPVHEPGSGHFLTCLFGRLFWEGTLGLPPDPALDPIWQGLRSHPEWNAKRMFMAESLERMAVPFAQGLNLSNKLVQEFNREVPLKDRITLLHSQLVDLGVSLVSSSKNGGLFGDFLKYELMDTDFAPYPQLASIFEAKYRRLLEWTKRFQETLVRLSGP
jgi:ADP-heptose:LPS heptosyltransferase